MTMKACLETRSGELPERNQWLPIIDLPDELYPNVLSFCDFASLLNLRLTNGKVKVGAEIELEKRAIGSLPLWSSVFHRENPRSASVKLKMGWSEIYSSRESLIKRATFHANLCAQEVPHGTDYDKVKAENLLRLRGGIDSSDFCGQQDEGHGSASAEESDWSVNFRHEKSVTLRQAWQVAHNVLSVMTNQEELSPGRVNQHGIDKPVMRRIVFSLLLGAKPSSICHGSVIRLWRHSVYPQRWRGGALMFRTRGNKQIELRFSNGTCGALNW